jgi:hypothetical protein
LSLKNGLPFLNSFTELIRLLIAFVWSKNVLDPINNVRLALATCYVPGEYGVFSTFFELDWQIAVKREP